MLAHRIQQTNNSTRNALSLELERPCIQKGRRIIPIEAMSRPMLSRGTCPGHGSDSFVGDPAKASSSNPKDVVLSRYQSHSCAVFLSRAFNSKI